MERLACGLSLKALSKKESTEVFRFENPFGRHALAGRTGPGANKSRTATRKYFGKFVRDNSSPNGRQKGVQYWLDMDITSIRSSQSQVHLPHQYSSRDNWPFCCRQRHRSTTTGRVCTTNSTVSLLFITRTQFSTRCSADYLASIGENKVGHSAMETWFKNDFPNHGIQPRCSDSCSTCVANGALITVAENQLKAHRQTSTKNRSDLKQGVLVVNLQKAKAPQTQHKHEVQRERAFYKVGSRNQQPQPQRLPLWYQKLTSQGGTYEEDYNSLHRIFQFCRRGYKRAKFPFVFECGGTTKVTIKRGGKRGKRRLFLLSCILLTFKLKYDFTLGISIDFMRDLGIPHWGHSPQPGTLT